MSWYDYIPGVNVVGEAINGRWSDAGKNLITGGLYSPLTAAGGAIKDAYDAPFDEKRAGYDAIMEKSQMLKAEREGRKDKAYNMAEEQYRPAREAIAAVYGDPKSWKL